MEFGGKQVITLEAGGYTAWALPEAGGQLIRIESGLSGEPAVGDGFEGSQLYFEIDPFEIKTFKLFVK